MVNLNTSIQYIFHYIKARKHYNQHNPPIMLRAKISRLKLKASTLTKWRTRNIENKEVQPPINAHNIDTSWDQFYRMNTHLNKEDGKNGSHETPHCTFNVVWVQQDTKIFNI